MTYSIVSNDNCILHPLYLKKDMNLVIIMLFMMCIVTMIDNKNLEHAGNVSGATSPTEALQTLTNMYNGGVMTVTSLHCTGDITVDGNITATKNITATGTVSGGQVPDQI